MDPVVSALKILMITPTLECGGAERFVSLLCNNMRLPGLQLHLAVINNRSPFYSIDPSVPLTDLGASRVSRSYFALRKLIKKVRPDIVFTTANHLNLFAAICRPFFPENIVWIARETSVVSINASYSRQPNLYKFLLRTFYRKLDHIICQSPYMQEDLVKNFAVPLRKTTVIYNAVDPTLQYQEGIIQHNSFITVARLSVEKGIDKILQATAELNIPFHYTIIGDGPQRKNLEDLSRSLNIADSVTFLGQQQRPFAGRENSHLYIMGSHYEGFPNSVIEANVLGIPVVARKAAGGIADIIIDGVNGFVASDDKDFRDKILIAAIYPFNRKQISEYAAAQFSIKRMTAEIAELFLKLSGLKRK